MNIVMLSTKDFSGSGWNICKAINKRTNHSIKLIKAFQNAHRHPEDVLLYPEEPEKFAEKNKNYELAKELIKNADIVHFKGDDVPRKNWHGFDTNKLTICTVSGSGFRRSNTYDNDDLALATFPIINYVKNSNLRTALTPDLNYPEYEGIYTQQAIDSSGVPLLFNAFGSPIIAHSPSVRSKKGTDNIIIPVIKELQAAGLSFYFDLIEGVSNKECIFRKSKATIFIDQICNTGFYGVSALEAMQFGIPTIANISNESIKQSNDKLNDCAVLKAHDKQTLYNLLYDLLTNKSKLGIIASQTKNFCDRFHSYEAVASMWDSIYSSLKN